MCDLGFLVVVQYISSLFFKIICHRGSPLDGTPHIPFPQFLAFGGSHLANSDEKLAR